jgi:glycosyltransferase involved in cell wall biosynthesis
LFLGRIYPVKGLPMLIEAWNRVRPRGWQLRIAGADEGGHKAEVEQAVLASGLCEVVSFVGPVHGATKEWETVACGSSRLAESFRKFRDGGSGSPGTRGLGSHNKAHAMADGLGARLRLVRRG